MKVLALAAVLAAFICPPLYAGWERLHSVAPYPVGAGTAIAAGRCDAEAGIVYPDPTHLVWLLHGDCRVGRQNCFERWYREPPPEGRWDYREPLPFEEPYTFVDGGGALAYVPDPYAYPPTGRLFAFTGNNTPYFWSYSPAADTWVTEPALDDGAEIGDGGALCYGGIWEFDGIPHGVLYAFIGGGSPRFFRYAYPLSPTRRPSRSTGWTELAPVMQNLPVEAGGCLTWCPLPDNPDHPMGVVVAMRGDATVRLYIYDPVSDEWSAGPFLPNGRQVTRGAAITTGHNGRDVYLWPGGAYVYDFFKYVYPMGQVGQVDLTPRGQRYGSGLAQANGVLYSVFADRDEPTYWKYELKETQEGPQSPRSSSPLGGEVTVRLGRGLWSFDVRCKPGPVKLRITDVSGSLVASIASTTCSDHTTLTWRHASPRTGVFLYTIDTPSGFLAGKLLAIH